MNPYPEIKGELPRRATYFVSFWWAILWKEALALAVIILMWQGVLSFFPGSIIAMIILAALTCWALFYFFAELFYAQLEKRYLRKNVSMICIDKAGEFVEPRIEHARALLWSFIWGHVSLILLAAVVCAALSLAVAIWSGASFFALFWGSYIALFDRLEVWLIWGLIFAIYPHYWVWSRPFYNLAGFRFALVDEEEGLKAYQS